MTDQNGFEIVRETSKNNQNVNKGLEQRKKGQSRQTVNRVKAVQVCKTLALATLHLLRQTAFEFANVQCKGVCKKKWTGFRGSNSGTRAVRAERSISANSL